MKKRTLSLIYLSVIFLLGILSLIFFVNQTLELSFWYQLLLFIFFYFSLLVAFECTWKEFHFYHKFNSLVALVYILFCVWIIYQKYTISEFSNLVLILGVLIGICSLLLANHSYKNV